MRKSINVAGLSHGRNPIPAASRIGNSIMSGAIFGLDTATGKLPQDQEGQCQLMFANAGRILEAAGATLGDVLKMTFYLHPDASRELLNKYWLEAFPHEDSRPARHVIVSDRLPATMHMQCDLYAVVSEHA